MPYTLIQLPYRHREIAPEAHLIVSDSGDYAYLPQTEWEHLAQSPDLLPLDRIAELKSKYILGSPGSKGIKRLLASRIRTKSETLLNGPSLHIMVPTLQCAHTCQYCQVSRALDDNGFSMSVKTLEAACRTILESPSDHLSVEFQGGDPLLRFDLVKHAIEYLVDLNSEVKKHIRFVVASSLHQLTPPMCEFFKHHSVYLSTSLDGPRELHNKNRPLPTRDAYERTLTGIDLARAQIGADAVSALMTTTKESLRQPEAIVDEYIERGFNEIFIRPLNPYGFAARNTRLIAYNLDAFMDFYERALEQVLAWNLRGVDIREVTASILFNKILSPFDAGYVDLQSPTGAGQAVLAYNYDGFVYPSDEARMLAESGDTTLRLGRIGEPLSNLCSSPVVQQLVTASVTESRPGCRECAFKPYCGPDPVTAYAQHACFDPPVNETEHCQRQQRLFESLFRRLNDADEAFMELAYHWAKPCQGAMHA